MTERLMIKGFVTVFDFSLFASIFCSLLVYALVKINGGSASDKKEWFTFSAIMLVMGLALLRIVFLLFF